MLTRCCNTFLLIDFMVASQAKAEEECHFKNLRQWQVCSILDRTCFVAQRDFYYCLLLRDKNVNTKYVMYYVGNLPLSNWRAVNSSRLY